MTASGKKAVSLTRAELYELVWKTPMNKLAANYGVSGNGLAKICDRLEVPYPPRGYWAKVAAKKPVIVKRLAPASENTLSSVVITPTEKFVTLPQVEGASPTTADQKLVRVDVQERLANPHPIISKWHLEHKRDRQAYLAAKAKDAQARRLNPWEYPTYNKEVRAYTDCDRRQHRILDALFKAAEKAGGKVGADENGLPHFIFNDEKFEFRITQHAARSSVAKSEKIAAGDDAGTSSKSTSEPELQISITTYIDTGARRSWRDGKRRTLEQQLPEFLQTVIQCAPLLAERHRKQEEEHRRWEEQRRRREERERREKLEGNRWKRLCAISDRWATWQRVGQLVAQLEAGALAEKDAPPNAEVVKWLSWAKEQLKERNPIALGASEIFKFVGQATEWSD